MTEPTIGANIGPFTILEAMPAGHGGMARVYIAAVGQHAAASNSLNVSALPDRVALKIARVLTGGASTASDQAFYFEALNNEVENLKRLRHPGIVRLFPIPRGLPRNPYAARASELEGMPWFCAMEYLGGGSLEARLKTLGTLPLPEAVEIAYQVGLALDHIHAKGMTHLDVKPDNILFRYTVGAAGSNLRNLQPVLIDFGIAAKLSKAGPQAGSIPFMAPERIRMMRGELPPELATDLSKADVYGLGVLLYRMLAGHLPYENLPREQLTSAILDTQPRNPRAVNPEVSPKIDEIIMSILAKDPAQRPGVAEVVTRLDEAMLVRPPAPPLARLRPRQTGRPWLVALLSLALVFCATLSLVEAGLLARMITQPVPTTAVEATITFTPTPPDTATATATHPPTPTSLTITATPKAKP